MLLIDEFVHQYNIRKRLRDYFLVFVKPKEKHSWGDKSLKVWPGYNKIWFGKICKLNQFTYYIWNPKNPKTVCKVLVLVAL